MTIWNASDEGTGTFTLTNSNLTATSASAGTIGIRGTNPKTLGKRYLEITCGHIGFRAFAGIANSSAQINDFRTSTTNKFGVNDGGTISVNGNPFGTSLATGVQTSAVIDLAVDFTANLAWIRAANGNWNGSALANPSTGVGGADISAMLGGGLMPIFVTENSTDVMTLNVNGSGLTNAAPAGFDPWDFTTPIQRSFGVVIS